MIDQRLEEFKVFSVRFAALFENDAKIDTLIMVNAYTLEEALEKIEKRLEEGYELKIKRFGVIEYCYKKLSQLHKSIADKEFLNDIEKEKIAKNYLMNIFIENEKMTLKKVFTSSELKLLNDKISNEQVQKTIK